MRAVRALTGGFGISADQPWLPGLPHAVAALATYFVFGGHGLRDRAAAGDPCQLRRLPAGDRVGVERRPGHRFGCARACADDAIADRAAGLVDADRMGGRRAGRISLRISAH